MTPAERNAALNVLSRVVEQALADVIVLTRRRDMLRKKITPARLRDISERLNMAKGALIRFEETLNA